MQESIRQYVLGLVQENLGLSQAQVRAEEIPADLVDLVSSVLRGKNPGDGEVPYVDEKLKEFQREVKRTSMERDGFFVCKARWPIGSPYAVCLTHDIDNISHSRGHMLSTRERFKLGDLILGLGGLRSLYDNMNLITNEERRRGFRSSFFLLTSAYSLENFSPSLKVLKEEGWDFGLHGDLGTHDSFDKMKESLRRFEKETGLNPAGVREHYLRFDFGKTWEIMESLGFAYDTTVGARDSLGFPLGLSTPFHPPDREWEPMKLLEIPLILMDTTLWGYLKRSEEQGMSDIRLLIKKVKEVGGLFTLLWHPEAFKMRGGRLYPQILEGIAEAACYVASAEAVAAWWNARSVPLVREKLEYRFEGPPPKGLCLNFESVDGSMPKVEGGNIERAGTGQIVRVNSSAFRLRVA